MASNLNVEDLLSVLSELTGNTFDNGMSNSFNRMGGVRPGMFGGLRNSMSSDNLGLGGMNRNYGSNMFDGSNYNDISGNSRMHGNNMFDVSNYNDMSRGFNSNSSYGGNNMMSGNSCHECDRNLFNNVGQNNRMSMNCGHNMMRGGNVGWGMNNGRGNIATPEMLLVIVLAELIMHAYGRNQMDGFGGKNQFDNSLIDEIFNTRRRGALQIDDLVDIVQELSATRGNNRQYGNQGRPNNLFNGQSGRQNVRPNELEQMLSEMLENIQLNGRENQGTFRNKNVGSMIDQLRMRGNNDSLLQDVVMVLINRLVRSLDMNDHQSARFELDLLQFLLNNISNQDGMTNNIDISEVLQMLLNGYDMPMRNQFGKHDVIRQILRMQNNNGGGMMRRGNGMSGRTSTNNNNQILHMLRQWFRDQDGSDEQDFRDQRFRNFLGQFNNGSIGQRFPGGFNQSSEGRNNWTNNQTSAPWFENEENFFGPSQQRQGSRGGFNNVFGGGQSATQQFRRGGLVDALIDTFASQRGQGQFNNIRSTTKNFGTNNNRGSAVDALLDELTNGGGQNVQGRRNSRVGPWVNV
ncbi:hypothetical protein DFS34DRAFT_653585 [Phlyctochytrium arcticum]|nr:hypothetical protein DFS34DRAFT_653585 [Phlyctochytrium arcticum]